MCYDTHILLICLHLGIALGTREVCMLGWVEERRVKFMNSMYRATGCINNTRGQASGSSFAGTTRVCFASWP